MLNYTGIPPRKPKEKKLPTVKYVYAYKHKYIYIYFLKIMTFIYIKPLKLLYIQKEI